MGMQAATVQTQAKAPTEAPREVSRVPENPSRHVGPEIRYSGNQAMLRRLSRTSPHLQCKLTVGAVNDPLEAEADRVAEQVMRMPDPDPISGDDTTGPVRRKCAVCEEEEAGKLRRKTD